MKILELHSEIENYLQKHRLTKKFSKQKDFFELNPFHPSLNTELLEPKKFRFWSFRVDKKHRAIFIFRNQNEVEVLDVNNHYQ